MKTYSYILLLLIKLIILSCLFFPVFWAVSVFYDWWFSNSGFLLEIIHGSKQHYLRVVKQDWIASLPLSIFVAIIISMPLEKYRLHIYKIRPTFGFIIKHIFILITAIVIYRSFIPGIVFFFVSALLLSVLTQFVQLLPRYATRRS
ncbi:MAG: hypothetical protein GC149_15230 [Gammaproteobacteria bacterium]|nr:hypothetical protein [Gammaproteobacteria bacterium]